MDKKKLLAREMHFQIISFAMMIFLTLMAFLSVELNLNSYFFVPFALLLAVVQTIFQLYYFMHMKKEGHGFPQFFLYSGVLVGCLIIPTMMFLI